MKKNSKEYTTVFKTDKVWFVSDDDYDEMIHNRGDFEIDHHTFKATHDYIHSFAMGIQCKPIKDYQKKKIEYNSELCEEVYNKGYRLDDNLIDYTNEITIEQFKQWFKDNHSAEYIKYKRDTDYKKYNEDKVKESDLDNYLLQPSEPVNNPFKDYVKSHGNFMKKKIPYTYYAYDINYKDYCILHLICGESEYNIWTKDEQTKVFGVQKYCINPETGKVDKIFIAGKPHVEVYKGKDDDKIVICVESFVKAFTLWNSLKKKYTIITTHSKNIRDTDLRWVSENFKGYNLAILCDTDEETSDIVRSVKDKYMYYSNKERTLKSIFGITGNKNGKDINDSTRTAVNMCKQYFKGLTELNKIRIDV